MLENESKTILLVEDEAIIAKMEKGWLKNEGYSVIHCFDGEEALALISNNSPSIQLILMDIDLGSGMDGIDTSKEILKLVDIPIVFLSSHTEKEIIEKTEQITSYGFVAKSPNNNVLVVAIKMALKLFEAHKKILITNTLLNAINESSNEMIIFSLDRDYKYLTFNRKHKEVILNIWGKEIEIGMSMLDVIGSHPDSVKAKASFDRALAGESFVVIDEYGNENLQRSFWENHWNPIFDSKGMVTGLTCFVMDVTEKKMSEEMVKETADKFESIVKTSIDGFWINDEKGNLLDVNSACCQLLGYSREELLSMKISQIDIYETEEDVASHTKKIFEDGYDRFETKMLKKDGTILDVEVSTTYYKNNKLILAFIKDITEKKLTNSLLKESESKFRKAIEFAPFPIMIHLEDGTVETINNSWSDLTGYTLTDIPTIEKWTEKAHFEFKDKAAELIKNLFSIETKSKDVEFPVINSKGEKLIWDFSSAPLGTTKDGRRMVISMAKDITEKKVFQLELSKSEELFRLLVSKMEQGLALHEIIKDDTGKVIDYRFLEINDSYEKITGLKRDQVIGKTVLEILPKIESYWIEKYADVALTGKPISFENYATELGKHFSVFAYSPKKNQFAVIVSDITLRVEEEKIIKGQNEELKKVNASKDKLFSIIAHDLRSPFSGFMGLLEGLSKEIDTFTHDEIVESASIMYSTSKRIYELLNNLLDWARLQLGRVEYNPRPINLFVVVDEIEQLFKALLINKNISFNNLIDGNISVMGDMNMLMTVLRNLISNAIKFTYPNGKIFINAKTMNKFIEISVTDTGVGIPKNLLNNIFEVESAFTTKGTLEEEGSGLGLMLCKELVAKNKGTIRVISETDQGTSFFFTIPNADIL